MGREPGYRTEHYNLQLTETSHSERMLYRYPSQEAVLRGYRYIQAL